MSALGQGRPFRLGRTNVRFAPIAVICAYSVRSGSRRSTEGSAMNKTARLRKKKLVVVHDKMQRNNRYEIVAAVGRGFDPEFAPELTPGQMLALGVFGG